METPLIIANIIGFLACVITLYSFQRKGAREIFFSQIFSTALWAVHFVLLGAFSGAVMNIGNMIKAICLVYLDEKHVKKFVIAFVLILAGVFFCYIYEKPSDLLPLVSVTLGACLMFVRDNRYIVARISIIDAICWTIYAVIEKSIPGLVTDILIIISITTGMVRHEEKPFKPFRLKP
ncbi:MAG: hypothetical protein COB76_06405 [Alphaproteobacteria bacterium]|nr:MAG: hypothetical protein COB76_06405 [Alphaproteobacteria bacterium]